MPEGPETLRYTNYLRRAMEGNILTNVNIVSGRYTKKPIQGLEYIQFPERVYSVDCKGKFIYAVLNSGTCMFSTLGMSGGWYYKPTKHNRVVLEFAEGQAYFNDVRNFGTLKFVPNVDELNKKLSSLGPDMLSSHVSDSLFEERLLRKNKKTIVEALMDQSVISGVGNYIKSDSLWLAKISPFRIVETLSQKEIRNLKNSIINVMQTSYNMKGATILSYKNPDGSDGDYGSRFVVYNSKRDPLNNDVIKVLTPDGRSTYWVPEVQR